MINDSQVSANWNLPTSLKEKLTFRSFPRVMYPKISNGERLIQVQRTWWRSFLWVDPTFKIIDEVNRKWQTRTSSVLWCCWNPWLYDAFWTWLIFLLPLVSVGDSISVRRRRILFQYDDRFPENNCNDCDPIPLNIENDFSLNLCPVCIASYHRHKECSLETPTLMTS